MSKQYSRFVGLMRLVLPFSAAALAVIVVAWPYLSGREEGAQLSFTATAPGGPDEKIFMTNARYMNSDDKNQLYTLTADLMTMEEGPADAIHLTKLQADIMLNGGSWLALTADTGVFYRKNEQLTLENEVSFFSDAGYEFRTRRASINLASRNIHGDHPIKGQGPLGTLFADSFRIENQGKSVFFEGHVRMIYYPHTKDM